MEVPLGESHSGLLLAGTIPAGIISDGVILAGSLSFFFFFLVCSFFISAAENAFFSLTFSQTSQLKQENSRIARKVLLLFHRPGRLLISLQWCNMLLYTAIILLFFASGIRLFTAYPVGTGILLLEAIAISMILFFPGGLLPKALVLPHNVRVAKMMAPLLYGVDRLFSRFAFVMHQLSPAAHKEQLRQRYLSMYNLRQAIDRVAGDGHNDKEEKDILKGIASLSNIRAQQVMRPKSEVVALEISLSFEEVMARVNEWGYSRIPVYKEPGMVIGILHIKDLVPHLQRSDFDWTSVLRPPYFFPGTGKIDLLLAEFQEKRVHFAVIRDEAGAVSGIATMEDVLEEIFGEIHDEFDVDDIVYSKLDDTHYVFEGTTVISDICRLTGLDMTFFEGMEEESTIAAALMQLREEAPGIGDTFTYNEITFVIESADKNKINRVKMILPTSNT